MTRKELVEQIRLKKSYLCVGLDTDITKIPKHLLSSPEPVFEFNKRIIDATKDYCVSYKINTAFYEALGLIGWEAMERTVDYIPSTHFKIADAKRGDIGNTSGMYARAFFDKEAAGMDFDAITVAPYMGNDSVTPFLAFEGKWVIVLALTSSAGSKDFQYLQTGGSYLYEEVIKKANTWAGADRMMYVVGATKSLEFADIRKIAPDHFLLVPGIGAQGGSLVEVCKYGMNKDCGLIVNSSRAIIYASNGEDFAEAARAEALKVQQQMEMELEKAGII